MTTRPLAAVLAAAVVLAGASTGLAAPSDLPSGAVIAFTPETVCENLPGGWKEYAAAEGRVIVGETSSLPAASPAAAAPAKPTDYWTAGVALKPENLPRSAVSGTSQIVVTAPVEPARVDPKAVSLTGKPNMRLFGYQTPPTKAGESEALPVGYAAGGSVGRDVPAAVAVAPPYVALRYCVKD